MEDLRYPIGPYKTPGSFSFNKTIEQIDEIKNHPLELSKIVNSLTNEQIDTPYRRGGWSVRELVHHIADSHMNSYIRMKWALTEQNSTIKPYDQEAWARLPDAKAPISISLELISSLHTRWGYLLGGLGEKELLTEYNHPESGKQTLWQHIDHYAWHGRHHLAHITSLIERKNW